MFSAAIASKLGLQSNDLRKRISGLGGPVNSVEVQTQIQLTLETGSRVTFRGEYAAVTEVEALDVSVLGRDITGLLAVLVDQPGNVVCLLSKRHRYTTQQD